jgi:LuxR family transcriptional regulator, maltose regulon positive regulatory protein
MNSRTTQTDASPFLFARTKLRPPRLRSDTLPRPRLVETIRQAIANVRLALLSAPAGYGKTTLVASAVSQLPATRIVWLTVDEEDDEPIRFFSAFAAAWQGILPHFAQATVGLLAAGGISPQRDPLTVGRAMMTSLVNELFDDEQPLLLILDDLHYVVNETIHASLNFLIERLPPHVTMIITTRHDPPLALAQLRARRELVELRLEELRFTPEETVTLLNQHFGLALDSGELKLLMARTEGWAAGMTLITASLQRIQSATDRTAFFEQIANSNRYLFDYLAEAVLGREDETTRDFLIATSILDVLTPALCGAVTGVTNAGQMLDQLYRRNLFLVGLAGWGSVEQTSYRYHDLFRTFLHDRAQRAAPETLRGWHRRAAQAAERPAQKIHHFLQAAAWEEAALVIEEYGRQLINENRWQPLQAWIKQLPDPLRTSRPRLHYLLGVLALGRWELPDALDHLQQAVQQLERQAESAQQGKALGEALVSLSVIHYLLGNVAAAAPLTERALALPITVAERVLLLTGRIWQRTMANDAAQVCVDLDQAMDLIEAHADREGLSHLAAGFRAPVLTMPGALARGERFLTIARNFAHDSPVITQAALYFLQGAIAMWRDEWAAMAEACTLVMELSKRLGGFVTIGLETEMLSMAAMRLAVNGDWAQAKPLFARFLDEVRQQQSIQRTWQLGALNLYARAIWMNQQVTELTAVYHQMVAEAAASDSPFKALLVDEIHALCWLTQGRTKEALPLLRSAVANRPPIPLLRMFGEARLTLAYAALLAGERTEALTVLAAVLGEIEAANTPGQLRLQGLSMVIPLLQLAVENGVHAPFAGTMLARLGQAKQATIPPIPAPAANKPLTTFRVPDTGETLTEREIEVLRLIARGADNATIATEMIISLNTVKTHVAHLLGKLGVPSRTAAAIKAKELGLVK